MAAGDAAELLARSRQLVAAGVDPDDAYARTAEEALAALDGESLETWPLLSDLIVRPELLAPPEEVLSRLAWRGRASLLAAADKIGKSTYAAHGVVALSRGGWWLGQRVAHGYAVVCAPDEALGDTVRRLAEIGADPQRVRLLAIRPPDLLASLRELLEAWPADLIVIDSLSEWARIVRGGAPEDGDAAGWGMVVRPLVEITRDWPRVALITLHHVRRSDGQYRGSLEIAAAMDALLELRPAREGEDAAVRRITGRARWPVEPYAVALRDGRYELVGGAELALDTRILIDVEAHPGTSVRALRERVSGRATAISAAVETLIGRAVIERRTDGRLYPTVAQQAEMGGL